MLGLLSGPVQETALSRGAELAVISSDAGKLMPLLQRAMSGFITEAGLPCGSEVSLTAPADQAVSQRSIKFACTGTLTNVNAWQQL